MSDEEIMRFEYVFLRAALLLMKHRLERDYLLEHLPEIFTFVEADSTETNIETRIDNLKYALRYLQGFKAIKWQEAKEKLQPLNLTCNVMDVLEEVKLEGYQEGHQKGHQMGRQEGRREGRQEGRQEGMEMEKFFACRNMIQKNFEKDLIAGILECSVDFVANVKGHLTKEPLVVHMLQTGHFTDAQIIEALDASPFLVEAVKKDMK